jgi:hypothetical protein
VLESSEDGRLLGKKRLNELVRVVVGLGKEGGEGGNRLIAEAGETRTLSFTLYCSTLIIPSMSSTH